MINYNFSIINLQRHPKALIIPDRVSETNNRCWDTCNLPVVHTVESPCKKAELICFILWYFPILNTASNLATLIDLFQSGSV